MKVTGGGFGQAFAMTVKKSIVAKDASTATLKIEMTLGDKVIPAREVKKTLGELNDPLQMAANAKFKGKVEKVAIEASEKLERAVKVKGKDIDCEPIRFRVHAEANGKMIESVMTVWTSPAVPLGIAKTETKTSEGTSTGEIVDFGWGK
jgi:hypothetical protein